MQHPAPERSVDRLLRPDIQQLLRDQQVELAFLFGSRARRQGTDTSDVDIAVRLPGALKPISRLEVADALSSKLRRVLGMPVDVVVLNDCSPLVRFEAVIRGVTILGADIDQVARYEKQVRMQFEDFEHIQRFYVRELRDRLGIKS